MCWPRVWCCSEVPPDRVSPGGRELLRVSRYGVRAPPWTLCPGRAAALSYRSCWRVRVKVERMAGRAPGCWLGVLVLGGSETVGAVPREVGR